MCKGCRPALRCPHDKNKHTCRRCIKAKRMAAACDDAESVNLDLETNFGDCEDELDLEGFELPPDSEEEDDADSGEFEQEAIRDSDYDSIDDFGSDSDDADDDDGS